MMDAATISAMVIVNETNKDLIDKIKRQEVVYDMTEHQYVDTREKSWKDAARLHGMTNTNYIISNYKTDPCERPVRLCRRSYSCPQYHNSKERRRNPRKYNYRTTVCSNVKRGDEWGEPSDCRSGDNCYYCHTKTEQQFHPQIYKSLKCNDIQQTGSCPRGFFCSFAHFDQEMFTARETTIGLDCLTDLTDTLSNGLPMEGAEKLKYPIKKIDDDKNINSSLNEVRDLSECTSNSSPHNKVSDAQFTGSEFNVQQFQISNTDTIQDFLNSFDFCSSLPNLEPQRRYSSMLGCFVSNDNNNSSNENHFTSYQTTTTENCNLNQQIDQEKKSSIINNHLSSNIQKPNILGNLNQQIDQEKKSSIINNHLSSNIQEPNILGNLNQQIDQEKKSSIINNHLSSNIQEPNMFGNLASDNIPLTNYNSVGDFFNWSKSSSLKQMQNNMIHKSVYNQQDDLVSLNIVTSNKNGSNSLFDNGSSGTTKIFPNYPSNSNEVQRLQEELFYYRSKLVSWESEQMTQVKYTYEAWKKNTEDLNVKLKIVEQERDKVINHSKSLQQEVSSLQVSPYLRRISRVSEIGNLSLSILKSLQSLMRSDLEEIEKALYLQTATKCILCEERNRSVTLRPCNHLVLCNLCIYVIKDCPYCSSPILSYTNTSTSLP